MKYRAEIDGLRALAVVPVILFHAGFEFFSGGFVGVDVFFVISGYLITTILIDDIEKNRFSLVNFYERRARRILPVLFFVMFVCMPFAWMWMLPSQMKDFSQSLIAVSFFASNILFWRESGYFDAAAEEKPLLHTWSLAVEEQYYVLFPIFLFFAWRFGKNKVFWMLAVFSAFSLALSEWGWRNNETANFYLAPTRAWELFSGSIAAFIVQKRGVQTNNILSLLGLAAIIFAIFAYDESTPFPSVYALVPVIGVLLLIFYGDKKTLAAKLLSTKVFVGIGLISYSAYLWHQPLFAFARIKVLEPSEALFSVLAILSIIFAYLSWRYIEQPFRNKEIFARKQIFSGSFVGVTCFLCLGAIGSYTNGFQQQRYDEAFLARNDINYLRSNESKFLGNQDIKASWMLLGDSHADALQDGFSDVLKAHNQSSIVRTIEGCPPAMNLWRHDINYGDRCHENYAEILNIIQNKQVSNVLISARYALYLNSNRFDNGEGGIESGGTDRVIYDHFNYRDEVRIDSLRYRAIESELVSYVKELSRLGVNIYIITSIPEVGWNVPEVMMQGGIDITTKRIIYDKRVDSLKSFYSRVSDTPNVTLLHSEDVLCDELVCIASQDTFPLYYDTNHLSIYGARLLLDGFTKKLFQSNPQ